jgi:hypothetical protein
MSASSFHTALSTFDRSGVGFSLGDIDDAFVGHTFKRYKRTIKDIEQVQQASVHLIGHATIFCCFE